MEVLTCLEIQRQFKVNQGSNRENRNPPSTPIPNLAPEWLSALVLKGQALWIIYTVWSFRRKSIGSWIFPWSPGGNVDIWSPLAWLQWSQGWRHFGTSACPLTLPMPEADTWEDWSNQLYTLSSQMLAAKRKGEVQAGWTWNTALAPPEFQVPQGVLLTTWNWGCFKVQMHCVCVSCFCLHLNTSTRWKPEGVGYCKQFWL